MTYVEQDCTIEHEGRKFEAGGAVVTDDYVIGYPDNNGVLSDWHGEYLGTYRILSSWRTPRSFMSDKMYSIECFVNHVRYVGRGAGKGMILRAKRSPLQPRLQHSPANQICEHVSANQGQAPQFQTVNQMTEGKR